MYLAHHDELESKIIIVVIIVVTIIYYCYYYYVYVYDMFMFMFNVIVVAIDSCIVPTQLWHAGHHAWYRTGSDSISSTQLRS